MDQIAELWQKLIFNTPAGLYELLVFAMAILIGVEVFVLTLHVYSWWRKEGKHLNSG